MKHFAPSQASPILRHPHIPLPRMDRAPSHHPRRHQSPDILISHYPGRNTGNPFTPSQASPIPRYPHIPLPRKEYRKSLHTIPGVTNPPISSYPITQEGRDKTICDSLASAILHITGPRREIIHLSASIGVCKTPIIRNPVHRRCAGKATH